MSDAKWEIRVSGPTKTMSGFDEYNVDATLYRDEEVKGADSAEAEMPTLAVHMAALQTLQAVPAGVEAVAIIDEATKDSLGTAKRDSGGGWSVEMKR